MHCVYCRRIGVVLSQVAEIMYVVGVEVFTVFLMERNGMACRDFVSCIYLSTCLASPSRWRESALPEGCQVTGYKTWLLRERK